MKLIKRTKILLSILQEMGKNIADTRMRQLLFLYCHEFLKNNDYYDFIPLNSSPYSLQAVEDKKSLIKNNILEKSDDWILVNDNKRFAIELDFFEKIAIQDLRNKFLLQSDEEITNYILFNFPYYSELYSFQNCDEIIFYTIGYEGLSPELYINLLLQQKVRLLVDVRKNAFSQKYGFSKSELRNNLSLVGIEYLHVPELGILSEKRQNLNSDSDYEELFREYENTTLKTQQNSLVKLKKLLEEKRRIAITCFEAEPYHCHRSRISKALKLLDNFPYKIEHLQSCKHIKPLNLKR